MTNLPRGSRQDVPITVQAEAAAWIARLHGAERSSEDDEGFRRWLDANEQHAATFDRMTELWEGAARLKSNVLTQQRRSLVDPSSQRSGRRFRVMAAAVCLAALAVFSLHDPGIFTAVGERRELTLPDGTRLTLNTATRVQLHFDKKRRLVELREGEALFDVSKHPGWPFVVRVAGREVTAVGTEFVVRRDDGALAITLIEGRVVVSPAGTVFSSRSTGLSSTEYAQTPPQRVLQPQHKEGVHQRAPSKEFAGSGGHVGDNAELFTLVSGQRITFTPDEPPIVDQPQIDKVTAWREGLIALDNLPLQKAVAEMNRYSMIKLTLADAQIRDVPVSGIFHAGDTEEFAKALALTHGIEAHRNGNILELTRP